MKRFAWCFYVGAGVIVFSGNLHAVRKTNLRMSPKSGPLARRSGPSTSPKSGPLLARRNSLKVGLQFPLPRSRRVSSVDLHGFDLKNLAHEQIRQADALVDLRAMFDQLRAQQGFEQEELFALEERVGKLETLTLHLVARQEHHKQALEQHQFSVDQLRCNAQQNALITHDLAEQMGVMRRGQQKLVRSLRELKAEARELTDRANRYITSQAEGQATMTGQIESTERDLRRHDKEEVGTRLATTMRISLVENTLGDLIRRFEELEVILGASAPQNQPGQEFSLVAFERAQREQRKRDLKTFKDYSEERAGYVSRFLQNPSFSNTELKYDGPPQQQ